MALKVWLPLNGNLENKGISNTIAVNNGATIDNNGKIGKCYSLVAGNHIDIDTNNVNNHKYSPISIACWVYFSQADSTQRYIIDCLEGGGCGFCWQNQQIEWMIYVGEYKRCWSNTLTLNEWHHVCGTYDGEISSIYIDGVLQNTLTASGSITYHATCPWEIGGNPGPTAFKSGNLIGSLNDIRIYDHCLSAKEVKEISQALILHYKLDNCVSDGNDNLLLRTKMDAAAQAEFVSNSSTDFTKLFRYYNGNAGLHTFSETDGGGFEDTVALSTTGNLGIAFVRANSELNLDPNSYYTLSCEAKCTSASKKLAIGTSYRTTGNAWTWRGGSNAQSFTGVNTWQTFQYTFKPDSNILYICYCFTVSGSANGTDTFTIRHCKLEKGSSATEWSPAPEEGIIFNKIVDSSGYGNDGILSQYRKLYLSSDSKRYNKSIYLPKEKSLNAGFRFPMLIQYTDIPENTLCLWIKPTENNKYSPNIYDGYFDVDITDANKLSITMYNTSRYLSAIPHITYNEWNFIALVYTNKILYGYVNGQFINNWDSVQNNEHVYPTQSEGSLHDIGNNFIGNMSDARIYATALSAEDILDLYHTSANIDNLGGIHGFEFVENQNQISIKQNGLVLNEELDEMNFNNNAQFMKETKNIVARNIIEK